LGYARVEALATRRAWKTLAAAARPATTERWHEVASGDTLSKLAAHYYGNGREYMRIFEANRDVLTNPDRIRVGQRLRVP